MKDFLKVLGCRGSIPVSGPDYVKYGGASYSVLLYLAGEVLVVDAGTGLMNFPPEFIDAKRVSLFLSHPHLDHLLGFALCPYAMRADSVLNVYAKERDGRNGLSQLSLVMGEPLWPIGPLELPAKISFPTLPNHLKIGEVKVDVLEGPHPGGVSLFRFSAKGKTVVSASDFTLFDDFREEFTAFAKDCDLLLCDGQYSESEWPARKTFGHNTWNMAASLGRDCGAKELLIVHHDSLRKDKELDDAMAEITALHPNARFAREGEEVVL